MAIPPIQPETVLAAMQAANSPVGKGTSTLKPELAELNAPADFVPDWIPTAHSPRSRQVGANSATPSVLMGLPVKTTPANTLKAAVQLELEPEADDAEELQMVDVVAAAPPWMVSLAFHLVFMVILAIMTLPQLLDTEINLNLAFSESLGEQIEEETFSVDDAMPDDVQVSSQVEMESVEDPLMSQTTDLLEAPNQPNISAPFESPSIGLALTGREQGMKNTLLVAYGGDQTTELAVYLALEWLRKNQQKDGSWRLDGPYSDGAASNVKNRLAATSMALLAFQGAGFTQDSTRQMINEKGQKIEVDYRRIVRRGWKQMLSWQDNNGCFYRKARVDHPHHKLYSQAQATIAICELYAMTRDSQYRRPAQRAVNYCIAVQDRDGDLPDGGWKYDEGRESDMSVTGWFVMALQSARMAGLDVPSDVFERITGFLESVSDEGSYYSYMPGAYAKPALTAEGLLCRQYLGWKRDDPRLIKGVEYLLEKPIDWSDTNTYYWYYATQVMHHMEGDYWFDWNQVMKREIPRMQTAKGVDAGSWSPAGDIWGRGGGRLYMTCMCTYMLEVYYRHLPIYAALH